MYHGSSDAMEATSGMGGEIVFPYTENAPTLSAECAGDEAVARDIRGHLLAPEGAAGARRKSLTTKTRSTRRRNILHGTSFQPLCWLGMYRTSMPETAVNENRDAFLGKEEIGADGNSRTSNAQR
jgi:hypothetical protein